MNLTMNEPNSIRGHDRLKDIELSSLFLAINQSDNDIDCYIATLVLSELLNRQGIKHQPMLGVVISEKYNKAVAPHYWISLDKHTVIDSQLKAYFEEEVYDEEAIPFGVVLLDSSSESNGFLYKGEPTEHTTYEENKAGTIFRLNDEQLDIFTDGYWRELPLATPSPTLN